MAIVAQESKKKWEGDHMEASCAHANLAATLRSSFVARTVSPTSYFRRLDAALAAQAMGRTVDTQQVGHLAMKPFP